MAKKFILALVILVIAAAVLMFNFIHEDSIDIYIDGENVSVHSNVILNFNQHKMNAEICDYTIEAMNDTDSNITTLRNGIRDICYDYGIENPTINIDSAIGENQIPIIVYVSGTSMLPTLQDGQSVLLNKTKDIRVGDIVVADSDEYGGIIKRVDEIEGNQVHLVSDNKNVEHTYENGVLYEFKGVSTWVDISDINGVVIEY